MTHTVWAGHIGSDFDAFLFAPIGDEKDGMTLSVISALARLDIDPWREAAQLASLSALRATERMASLIAALPDASSAHRNSGKIAASLIALLPRRSSTGIAADKTLVRKTLLNADETTQFHAGTYMSMGLVLFMLLAQWMVAGVQAPQAGGAVTSSATVIADTPHINAGVSEK